MHYSHRRKKSGPDQEQSQATVYVFVGSSQGVIDEVEVHRSLTGAKRAFHRFTGVSYDALQKALARSPELSAASILGDKLGDCEIFETSLS